MSSTKVVVVRELNRLRQPEAWLAREMGLTRQSLNQMLMRGNFKWESLGDLAKALGIKKSKLINKILKEDGEC